MAQYLSGGSLTSRGDFLSGVIGSDQVAGCGRSLYSPAGFITNNTGLPLMQTSVISGDSVNRAVNVAEFFFVLSGNPRIGEMPYKVKKKSMYI